MTFDRFLRWLLLTTKLSLFSALLLLPVSLIASLQSPSEALQGESVLYLYLHVPAAVTCFLLYSMMSVGAIGYLIWRLKAAYLFISSALLPCFFMACVTLGTGALWGECTWGTYWVWDARLTSFLFLSLFLALLNIAQQHPRLQQSHRGRQIVASLVLVGLVDVFFVHQSVLWFKTLHQPPSFSLTAPPSMAKEFLQPLFLSTISFSVTAVAVTSARLHQRVYETLPSRYKEAR